MIFKQLLFYIIIALLFFLFSCKKEESDRGVTIVEGTVVEKHSGKSIKNISILIIKLTGEFGYSHGVNKDTIQKIITDENGSFFFRFRTEDEAKYVGYVEENECYQKSSVFEIEPEIKNEYKLDCVEYSSIVFHVINATPFNENDMIAVYGGRGTAIYSYFTATGPYIDKFFLIQKKLSYAYFNYSYEVIKNNQMIEKIDSIYINSVCSFDTITINY